MDGRSTLRGMIWGARRGGALGRFALRRFGEAWRSGGSRGMLDGLPLEQLDCL